MWHPRGLLWQNGDFLRLWAAQSVSQFGSQVTNLALPLAAILVLKASTFEVAALGVGEFLPFVLLSLPAGVWVDRLRRRPILIVADLGRGAALASIPLAPGPRPRSCRGPGRGVQRAVCNRGRRRQLHRFRLLHDGDQARRGAPRVACELAPTHVGCDRGGAWLLIPT